MSQYHHQQNYNQYTDPHQESSLNIEDQSGVAPPSWNSGPDSSSWGNSTGAPSYGSGPPVQPMYSSESQYQHPGYAPEPQAYMNPGDSGTGVEVNPGSLGQMDVNSGTYGGSGYDNDSFEEEQPLLKELGIDVELIKQKTLSVLNPMQQTDSTILSDTDLAGPLMFCLLFGVILLLSGKVHFGYIYGVGLLGCSSMYVVLNLMSSMNVSVGCVVSVLGYCLLPMVLLSSFSVVVHLQGILGTILSLIIITWCSFSASKLFVSVLSMDSMQLLVAYPCALLYGVFALLTIF